MAGFGYQILGFGSGGAAAPYNVQYLVAEEAEEELAVLET